MKMIINKHTCYCSLLALTALLIVACGKSKKEEEAEQARLDSLGRPESVKVVAAIAKVEPAKGFIELSADVSGIVVERFKKEGDSVKQGDPIIQLDKENETLELAVSKEQITAREANVAASRADLKQVEVNLAEKEEDLAVTKRLAATGADTRQNVITKERELEVLRANLESARAKLRLAISELTSSKNKLEQTRLTASGREVVAKQNGVLVDLNIKVGSAITAYSPFGTLAPTGDLVLHGEIDEMFATFVQTGQSVEVNYVGQSKIIASGKITYLSPILENKSLFYEQTGETSDRRVRRFKASFSSPEPLLINARVECKIKIQ